MEKTAAVIAGGGLSGLTAALHLRANGYPVILLEKHDYPRHKVCGEYVSAEVLPYLRNLGVDFDALEPARIDTLEFSMRNGKALRCKLPLGGIGLSRFALDAHLADTARKAGCEIATDALVSARNANGRFEVKTASGRRICSEVLIGAYGKRSELDKSLKRPFIGKKSPWVAQKFHVRADIETNVVGLHHFPGGYCGVSAVEQNRTNVCFISTYSAFRKAEHRADNLLAQNPKLARLLQQSERLTETFSIGQISFAAKKPVEDGWFMTGDTAGMIHPLCGNGMAMAIHSAKLACEAATGMLSGNNSRHEAYRQYESTYREEFSRRLATGRILASLLEWPFGTAAAFSAVKQFPSALPWVIRKTHGKPLTPMSL